MKFAPLLLSFLFAAITISAQVNPQCPNILVTGPTGMVNPAELISYTVTVKPTESKLTYKWTAHGGTIAEGQGEPTIKVRLEHGASNLTVTVEIGGLSEECPNRASETVSDLAGNQPIATKLDTFSLPLGSVTDQRFQNIADAINHDPTSQTFIFIPANPNVRDALVERLKKVVHENIDISRITYVEIASDNKIIEIWLVPPGANPPKCAACEEVRQPAITEIKNIPVRDPDVFGPISIEDEKNRLQTAALNLKNDGSQKLFIIKHYSIMQSSDQDRINQLSDYLVKSLKLTRDQFEFVVTVGYLEPTTMYFMYPAQPSNGPGECPMLSVTGPNGITNAGDVIVFRATAVGDLPAGSRFEWDVPTGIVESGQGTDSITVRVPSDGGVDKVRAVVRIVSPNLKCHYLFISEATVRPRPFVCGLPPDDYPKLTRNDERARLANAANMWNASSGSILLFVLYLAPNETFADAQRRAQFIRNFYQKDKIATTGQVHVPSAGIRLLFANSQNTHTAVYILPKEGVGSFAKTFEASQKIEDLRPLKK